MISTILLIVALGCFLYAAFAKEINWYRWTAGGLAAYIASLLAVSFDRFLT